MPVVNLTDAFIKGCRCDSGRTTMEFRDEDVSGLELRVSARGTKAWRLHYTRRSDGKRRVVGLGRYPTLSLKDARAKAKGLQGQIESHELRADPVARVHERRLVSTFGELAADWFTRHGVPNKSPRALRDDRSMLDRHILPEIGAMKISEIVKRDIIRLLDTVAAKPDARVGRHASRPMTHRPNRVFELVRSIFRWGVGRDQLQVDPTWGLSPPIKKEAARERALTADEIKRLWAVLDRAPVIRRSTKGIARGERVKDQDDLPLTRATALTLKLALVTAQRIGEIAGIASSELDLDAAAPVWIIPGERSKNRQSHRVPLSPLAVRLIDEARQLAGGSAWLFPSPSGNGPISDHAPTRALHRARAAIGLEDFRIHDLRRTAATGMAELQIAPHTISLVLNHVSARAGTITSKVYVQYSYDREKREALERWAARVEGIIDR